VMVIAISICMVPSGSCASPGSEGGLGDKYVDRVASADRDLFDRQPTCRAPRSNSPASPRQVQLRIVHIADEKLARAV
jgi:hypothetical protein